MPRHPTVVSRSAGVVRLLLCVTIIAVLWLVVLPWIAQRPAMDEHIQWLDDQGINPSAMYYTELESMTPILDRLNRQQRIHR